ncbi:hypothetical protein FYC62_12885 [Pedobacter aquae]|uniref:Uncharacterized protein n=1 Tax=Pedobacter aquae TaxID=2605747 RepID=A0A5C0VK16_9SPHI|nr:hypothetical protein [Pedobacter aquae]QEK52447.1 hypothetical protein FYC62_12885 [Pedobacter aquae]
MNAYTQSINLQGVWRDSTSRTDFILNLNQNGFNLSGNHISIQQNGKKIDAPDDPNMVTITGVINNQTEIIVNFISQFSNTSGTAKITIINAAEIKWEIINKPSGEYYIPILCILKKE